MCPHGRSIATLTMLAGAKPTGVAVLVPMAAELNAPLARRTAVAIDATSNAIVGTVPVRKPLRVSTPGRKLYTANCSSNDVAAVDTQTLKATGSRAGLGEVPGKRLCLRTPPWRIRPRSTTARTSRRCAHGAGDGAYGRGAAAELLGTRSAVTQEPRHELRPRAPAGSEVDAEVGDAFRVSGGSAAGALVARLESPERRGTGRATSAGFRSASPAPLYRLSSSVTSIDRCSPPSGSPPPIPTSRGTTVSTRIGRSLRR